MTPRVAKRAAKRARRTARRWEGESADHLRKRWRRPELHLFSTVDSTNDVARELAKEGAPAGALVLADAQSAGRGRGDRRWASPKGKGLYFTLVLRPGSLANPGLLPIRAGLGIVRVLARLVPDADPALKWPNDVWLDGKKCGGVLAEATWDGSRPDHVVVGVGLNVSAKGKDLPRAIRRGATSVEAASGRKVSR
ncbi:MAG: biotin--[acetyl-CoA-carboxylase] ligase, partial [Gemmatimonadota bacterium]